VCSDNRDVEEEDGLVIRAERWSIAWQTQWRRRLKCPEKVAQTVLQMAQNPERAKAKAEMARRFVEHRQEETMARLALELR
jgi:hypothetical protein